MNTPLPGISRQLLLAIALTNVAAVTGIVAAMWLTEGVDARAQWWLRALLVLLVLLVWTSTIRRRIERDVERPLQHTADVATAIATGHTERRVPAGDTREFDMLAQSINDMTDQLLIADQLRTRVEKLATLGRLAAGISHEIGNPIAAIANYAHVIRMRSGDAPVLLQPLDAMDAELARVDRIMRGMLDYARPHPVTARAVSVDGIMHDVLQLLDDQGVMRAVSMTSELQAADAQVFAEPHELEQAFVNLLLNAIDAVDPTAQRIAADHVAHADAEPQQPVAKIVVRTDVVSVATLRWEDRTRRTDDMVHWERKPSDRAAAWMAGMESNDRVLQIVIADSGVGVNKEDEEHIFEPFFTNKAPGKGTGLGLAIVARTVENIGGTIWVQPAREGGAAFVLLLPLHGEAAKYAIAKHHAQ